MSTHVFALLGPLGLPEMLIILAIVILIFGANRLPELGRGIGAGIKNFKAGFKDDDDKKG
jgi:sec-independent protein translocase protein TatA